MTKRSTFLHLTETDPEKWQRSKLRSEHMFKLLEHAFPDAYKLVAGDRYFALLLAAEHATEAWVENRVEKYQPDAEYVFAISSETPDLGPMIMMIMKPKDGRGTPREIMARHIGQPVSEHPVN